MDFVDARDEISTNRCLRFRGASQPLRPNPRHCSAAMKKLCNEPEPIDTAYCLHYGFVLNIYYKYLLTKKLTK